MWKRRIQDVVARVAIPAIDQGIRQRTDDIQFAVGVTDSRLAQLLPPPKHLRDTEFKVFSQWGEDGIIQHLVSRLSPPRVFVEIGVDDYAESNTRFLAMKDNWTGAIFDGGTKHVDFLRRTGMAWRWSITPVSAFVTAENVNDLIVDAGISGEIGLLSIDVDGVDYWLWKAVTKVDPWIVVIEHNSAFGPTEAVTVPYDPEFRVTEAHYSWQYCGASLAALHALGQEKGYRLVGVGSNGINAFFVRDDVAGDLWDLTPAEAHVPARIRNARDRSGERTYTGDDHVVLLRSMRDQPVHVVHEGRSRTIADVFGV